MFANNKKLVSHGPSEKIMIKGDHKEMTMKAAIRVLPFPPRLTKKGKLYYRGKNWKKTRKVEGPQKIWTSDEIDEDTSRRNANLRKRRQWIIGRMLVDLGLRQKLYPNRNWKVHCHRDWYGWENCSSGRSDLMCDDDCDCASSRYSCDGELPCVCGGNACCDHQHGILSRKHSKYCGCGWCQSGTPLPTNFFFDEERSEECLMYDVRNYHENRSNYRVEKTQEWIDRTMSQNIVEAMNVGNVEVNAHLEMESDFSSLDGAVLESPITSMSAKAHGEMVRRKMCGIYTKVVQNSRGMLKTIRISKEEFEHIEEHGVTEFAEFVGDDRDGIDYCFDKTVGAYVPRYVTSNRYAVPELPSLALREFMARNKKEVNATLQIFGLGDVTEEAREMIASSKELIEDVSDTIRPLRNHMDSMTSKVDVILGESARVSANVSGITSKLDEGMDKINSVLDSFQTALAPFAIQTGGESAISCVLRLIKTLYVTSCAQPAYRIRVFLIEAATELGPKVFARFASFVGRMFKDFGTSSVPAHLEMDLSFLSTIESIDVGSIDWGQPWLCLPIIGTLISTFLIYSLGLPTLGSCDRTLKFFGDRCRSVTNILMFQRAAGPMFESVIEWIGKCVHGEKFSRRSDLDRFLIGFDKWAADVLSLLKRCPQGMDGLSHLQKDVNYVLKIDSLYNEGIQFARELGEKRLSQELTQYYHRVFAVINAMKKACDTSGAFGNKPRCEPAVIHLFGESGVGKSGMAWPLATDLNAALAVSESDASDFARNIYFRNTEQEFWDGYQGQNIVVYDDFGQRADSQMAPNEEFMEIIRAANLAPYPLHMATLEEKRRTKFTSKVLMLTSNKLEYNVHSLTYPDAYRRRVDICGKVINTPETTKLCPSAATGKNVLRLDPSKCSGPVDTTVYRIQLYNAESMQPIPNTPLVDYEEFVDMCVEVMRERFIKSMLLNATLEERVLTRYEKMQKKFRTNSGEIIKAEEAMRNVGTVVVEEEIGPIQTPAKLEIGGNPFEEDLNPFGEPDNNPFGDAEYETFAHQLNNIRIRDYDTVDEHLDDLFREPEVTPVNPLNPFEIRPEEMTPLFRNALYASAKSFFETLKNNWKKIAALLTVVGVLIAGLGLWKKFSGGFNSNRKQKQTVLESRETVTKTPKVVVESKETKTKSATAKVEVSQNLSRIIESENEGVDCVLGQRMYDLVQRELCPFKIHRSECPLADVHKHPAQSEAFASGDCRTKSIRKVQMEGVDAEMEVWKDTTAQMLITNRVVSNLYRLSGVKGEMIVPLLNGMFIRDTIMLVPSHITMGMRECTHLLLENIHGAVFKIPVTEIKMCKISDSEGVPKDAALLKFPRCVGAHADLVKHFQLNYDMGLYKRADVCMPVLRKLTDGVVLMLLGNASARAQDTTLNLGDSKVWLREGLVYSLNTTAGDCGAPIILQETRCLRKIAGIHVAGANSGAESFAQSVTRKDLERALTGFNDTIITDYDEDSNITTTTTELEMNTEITIDDYVAKLSLPARTFAWIGKAVMAPFTPTKTEIVPSMLHGCVVEPTTKPAILYDREVNMKHKNLSKCAINTPFVDPELIDAAVNDYEAVMFTGRRPELTKVLTFEQAISGDSETSAYLGSINRSTSPGMPWVLKRKAGTKGKTGWLGDDEYIYNEEVREAVEYRLERAKQGIRVLTTWTDTLKDERRPIAKVNEKRTRVFSSGPMDYTILFRMFFLSFVAHVMENRIDNEQSVGTNVWGPDWGKTDRRLRSKGKKCFAGDFKEFDGRLNTMIMERFVECVNRFYNDGEENARVRRVLALDIWNSIHLCDEIYYSMNHSQPSGNPITTILNSFYNSVTMRIVYFICRRKAGVTSSTFEKDVAMVSYGDDNGVNLTDDIAPWFNQNTVTVAYAEIGMIYTDEAKTEGDVPPYRTLEEITYLKRKFRSQDGIVDAPLDLDVILEMTNWIRESPDQVSACRVNIEMAVMELSMHPRHVFDKWVPLIKEAFANATQQCGFEEQLRVPLYGEYRQMRFTEYFA